MRTVAAVMVLMLAACGDGGDPETKPTATPTTPTTSAPEPTIAAPTGTPAPEALSQFLCAKDAKGAWNASGAIANSTKNKATFQVTVHIGEAAASGAQAMTKQLADVEAGGSVKFALAKVPAPDAGGTCHVQVLRR